MEADDGSCNTRGAGAKRRVLEGSADSTMKQQRTSSGGEPLKNKHQRSPSDGLPHKIAELVAYHETCYRRAVEHCNDAAGLRERRAAELPLTLNKVHEVAATAAQMLDVELAAADNRARGAEEQMAWLEDVSMHCEKARSKQAFEGQVMETFCQSHDLLQRAAAMQRSRVQEVQARARCVRQAAEEKQAEWRELEAAATQARAALAEAEEGLAAAKVQMERSSEQVSRARGLTRLQHEAANIQEAVARSQSARDEAVRQAERAQLEIEGHDAWVGDLRDFFEHGRAARDAAAIVRGLQDAMPEGDPLPVMVQALLSRAPGSMDLASLSVAPIRELVASQLRGVSGRLQQQLEGHRKSVASCERAASEDLQQQRELEEQLRVALAEVQASIH